MTILHYKYDKDNPFAKILRSETHENEKEVDKVFEDDNILAFKDLYPVAPVHILVIPKKPVVNFTHFLEVSSHEEVGSFFNKIQVIITKLDINNDCRIITNTGPNSGQTVFHFHVHIISGKKIYGLE